MFTAIHFETQGGQAFTWDMRPKSDVEFVVPKKHVKSHTGHVIEKEERIGKYGRRNVFDGAFASHAWLLPSSDHHGVFDVKWIEQIQNCIEYPLSKQCFVKMTSADILIKHHDVSYPVRLTLKNINDEKGTIEVQLLTLDVTVMVDVQHGYSNATVIQVQSTQSKLYDVLAEKAARFLLLRQYTDDVHHQPVNRSFDDKHAFFTHMLDKWGIPLHHMLPSKYMGISFSLNKVLDNNSIQNLLDKHGHGLFIQDDGTLNMKDDQSLTLDTLSTILMVMCDANIPHVDSELLARLHIFVEELGKEGFKNQWETVSHCLMSGHPEHMFSLFKTLRLSNDFLNDVIGQKSGHFDWTTEMVVPNLPVIAQYLVEKDLNLSQRITVLFILLNQVRREYGIDKVGSLEKLIAMHMPETERLMKFCLNMGLNKNDYTTLFEFVSPFNDSVFNENFLEKLESKDTNDIDLLKEFVPVFKTVHEIWAHLSFMSNNAEDFVSWDNEKCIHKTAELYYSLLDLHEQGQSSSFEVIMQQFNEGIKPIQYAKNIEYEMSADIMQMIQTLWLFSNPNMQTCYVYNWCNYRVPSDFQDLFWDALIDLPNTQILHFGLYAIESLLSFETVYSHNVYIAHHSTHNLYDNASQVASITSLVDSTPKALRYIHNVSRLYFAGHFDPFYPHEIKDNSE